MRPIDIELKHVIHDCTVLVDYANRQGICVNIVDTELLINILQEALANVISQGPQGSPEYKTKH